MLCTSGFVDDVTFSHNEAKQPESKMMCTVAAHCDVATYDFRLVKVMTKEAFYCYVHEL